MFWEVRFSSPTMTEGVPTISGDVPCATCPFPCFLTGGGLLCRGICVDAWRISPVECQGGTGVELGYSSAELLRTFASVFRMSDGSVLVDGQGGGGMHKLPLRNTMRLLGDIGVGVDEPGMAIRVCEVVSCRPLARRLPSPCFSRTPDRAHHACRVTC